NLGDTEATGRAIQAFVDSFVRSLPTGKQNTFANRTLPNAVVAMLRMDQPVNLVGAFETSVDEPAAGGSRLQLAAEAFTKHAESIAQAYGSPEATWVLPVSDDVSALTQLGDTVDMTELVRRA